MMKETRKSLKIYFILVASLTILSIFFLLDSELNLITQISQIASVLIAIFYLYFGLRINHYLDNSPRTLKSFIITILIINSIFSIILKQFIYIIGISLLAWYLIHNIDNLSKKT